MQRLGVGFGQERSRKPPLWATGVIRGNNFTRSGARTTRSAPRGSELDLQGIIRRYLRHQVAGARLRLRTSKRAVQLRGLVSGRSAHASSLILVPLSGSPMRGESASRVGWLTWGRTHGPSPRSRPGSPRTGSARRPGRGAEMRCASSSATSVPPACRVGPSPSSAFNLSPPPESV